MKSHAFPSSGQSYASIMELHPAVFIGKPLRLFNYSGFQPVSSKVIFSHIMLAGKSVKGFFRSFYYVLNATIGRCININNTTKMLIRHNL